MEKKLPRPVNTSYYNTNYHYTNVNKEGEFNFYLLLALLLFRIGRVGTSWIR